jgi:hypothetical protein
MDERGATSLAPAVRTLALEPALAGSSHGHGGQCLSQGNQEFLPQAAKPPVHWLAGFGWVFPDQGAELVLSVEKYHRSSPGLSG